MDTNSTEKIEDYLKGKLSGKALLQFEEQIASDPDLSKEVHLHREVHTALAEKDVFRFREQLQAAGREYRAMSGGSTVERKMLPIRRLIAMAALILALIASLIWFFGQKQPTGDEIYASAFQPAADISRENAIKGEISPGTSPETTNAYQLWKEAADTYRQKEYGHALNIMQQIRADQLLEEDRPMYQYQLGYINMIEGQFDIAEKIFKNPDAANPDGRQWYLALILLKKNTPKETLKTVFGIIADDPSNPYRNEAAAVLKSIEKMQ